MASAGKMDGRAAALDVISGMLREAGGNAEVELRLGRIVDGAYESGVDHAAFERVRARLRAGVGLATSPEAFTHEVHSEGGVIRDVESGEHARKTRVRQTMLRMLGTPFAVRACLSTEERVSPPRARARCRQAADTAVRAKLRESFVYRDKARYDLTRCVTASVTGGMIAAPRCTYEVEVEAVGEITAESLLLKMEDVAGFLGPRPSGYAVHCA